MDLIKATNLNLHNGSKDILSNVCFRILEGHKYGLIGANGSGKTTLIRLILQEIEADKGSLILKKISKSGMYHSNPNTTGIQGSENFC